MGIAVLDHAGGLGRGLAAGRAVLLAPPVLAVIALVLLVERRWPVERRPWSARGQLQDAAYTVVHVLAVVPFMTLLSAAFAHILATGVPWVSTAWSSHVPTWLLLAGTFVLMDGANWLAHWADHRFDALWRVHALHHSQEELSVLTSFRAHPLSHLPGFMLAAVPPFVLLGRHGTAPALISAYVCLGTLPHANLSWGYGPLGRIFVSPAYHRLHHALDEPDGKNLGVVLTIWDVLAHRARWPASVHPAARPTGLRGRPVPVETAADRWHPGLLVRQLAEPFVRTTD